MSRSLLKRLKAMAPAIEWTVPIPVEIGDFKKTETGEFEGTRRVGFLCRICVADKGFAPAKDPGMIFDDEEACLKHIETAHVGSTN